MAKATVNSETVTEVRTVEVEKTVGVTLELSTQEAAYLRRMFDLAHITYLEQLFGAGYGGSRSFPWDFYAEMKDALDTVPAVRDEHEALQVFKSYEHRPRYLR